MGKQYQRLNRVVGCTQAVHLDPNAVMERLRAPLRSHPWDRHDAGVLLLMLPPAHRVPSQWQKFPVSSNWSLRVPMLWSMGPREAGAAWALLQLRGAGGTPGSTGLARGIAVGGLL